MTDGLPDALPRGIINGAIGSFNFSAGVSTEFLGPSSKRCGLIISVQTGVNVAINNRPITGLNDGLQWASNQTPFYFDEPPYAEMVKKPWFIFGLAAGGTVSWVELLRD